MNALARLRPLAPREDTSKYVLVVEQAIGSGGIIHVNEYQAIGFDHHKSEPAIEIWPGLVRRQRVVEACPVIRVAHGGAATGDRIKRKLVHLVILLWYGAPTDPPPSLP